MYVSTKTEKLAGKIAKWSGMGEYFTCEVRLVSARVNLKFWKIAGLQGQIWTHDTEMQKRNFIKSLSNLKSLQMEL